MVMGRGRVTLVLVNLAGVMEKADEALLPAVYKEVGAEFHVSPSGLGSLTLYRSLVQACCYPLASYLAVRFNRAHVIAVGAFLWAAATILFGVSSTFSQLAMSRAFNGVGLALVIPSIQSLIADSTDDSSRGTAFGWLQLTSNVGSVTGGLLALLLATRTFMGIPGWRVAFHVVGILSIIVGTLVCLFVVDPHYSGDTKSSESISQKPIWSEVKGFLREAKSILKIQSFQILVAQGIAGTFPWSSLSFTAMWLELIGFSHEVTGAIMLCFVIAGMLGGVFGGRLGDFLAGRFPNTGRIALAQISSAVVIPIAGVLMLALPGDPSYGFMYGLLFLTMGLFFSVNFPATSCPIFAEIVPEKSRAVVYAMDKLLGSIPESFAPFLVGLLAERAYGYKPLPEGSSGTAEVQADRENAAALAMALFTATGPPLSLCCFIYSFLYCSYPRDRDRALMEPLVESDSADGDENSLEGGD